MQSIIYILPELFLSVVIMTLLLVGVFIKKGHPIWMALKDIVFELLYFFNVGSY